jgi:hypothetical protein
MPELGLLMASQRPNFHNLVNLPQLVSQTRVRDADIFVWVESRPWLHQWTTILSEARLLGSFARAVSRGLRKSPPQTAQNKRPGLINLAVPKRMGFETALFVQNYLSFSVR